MYQLDLIRYTLWLALLQKSDGKTRFWSSFSSNKSDNLNVVDFYLVPWISLQGHSPSSRANTFFQWHLFCIQGFRGIQGIVKVLSVFFRGSVFFRTKDQKSSWITSAFFKNITLRRTARNFINVRSINDHHHSQSIYQFTLNLQFLNNVLEWCKLPTEENNRQSMQ